jgi:hypothetical protein
MIRPYIFKKVTKSVREYLLEYDQIDCYPVHQRLNRELKLEGTTVPSKAQAIIETMLVGIDIGQITLHETPNCSYKFESVDGGHRKRYIYAFYQNKFRAFGGKYFREMSKKEREAFLDIQVTFCIYNNLTGEQVGHLFRTLNTCSPVTHQEMLNSHGNTAIASAVRETTRPVTGVNNSYHQLFEFFERGDDCKYTNVSFNNDGLRIDEMVARLYYRYYDGGGLGTCCDTDLEKMYAKNPDGAAVTKMKKKVSACLDFVQQMAEIRKQNMAKPMPQKEFVLFSRIWMYLEETYGVISIPDNNVFFDMIYDEYSPFKLKYDNQPKELQAVSPLDIDKTIGKQFNDSLGEHRPAKSVVFPVNWLMDKINILSVIVVRDSHRVFPRDWREAKLVEQGYRCYVSGEKIDMSNAHGAHIIAWADGGKREYSNLAMVAAKHNAKMGTLSVHQYMELLG